MTEDNMNEADAAWTPAYESVMEAVREAQAKQTRFENTLLVVDTAVAIVCLAFLAYIVFM